VWQDGIDNDEYYEMTLDVFNGIDRVLKPNGVVLYNMSYGNQNSECMLRTIYNIIDRTDFTMADIMVWKKPNCTPNTVSPNKLTRMCEFVFVLCRRSEFNTFQANKKVLGERYKGLPCYETVFNWMEAKSTDSPTELNRAVFSTEFVTKLLHIYTHEGDVVLDPFMGTGTTAVGCLLNNRQYIGFELSKAQCEYAENRIEDAKNGGVWVCRKPTTEDNNSLW
jgi:DNA modification methylase